MSVRGIRRLAAVAFLGSVVVGPVGSADAPVERLVAAMLGETPLVSDLRHLTDVIGGRPTGSEANERSVEWGVERFREAGLEARADAFTLPGWAEVSARARVSGDAELTPDIVAMPYAGNTPPGGATAPLLDGGRGTTEDFERLGAAARDAFLLIETDPLEDLDGLFAGYRDGVHTQERAAAAGAAGVVFVGARERNALYRHNTARVTRGRPMAIVEREEGLRLLRLLRGGGQLVLTLEIEVEETPAQLSHNVVAEIPGTQRANGEAEEYVVIGAHLDSWGLGTGALDNGANVALVIDVARQMKRLGLVPRRTIRFLLWNGEEHGLHGSWGDVRNHAEMLDRTVMASSYDIGSGRIVGYFTGGRPEIAAAVGRALEPVRGMGPFQTIDIPLVGTDNFDYMMEGVGNLIAAQESANYGPHYHASTDTFDKVDLHQVKLNSAIAAAVTWGFANMDVDWKRQTRAEVQALVEGTDLAAQMSWFGVLEDWNEGRRGRRD